MVVVSAPVIITITILNLSSKCKVDLNINMMPNRPSYESPVLEQSPDVNIIPDHGGHREDAWPQAVTQNSQHKALLTVIQMLILDNQILQQKICELQIHMVSAGENQVCGCESHKMDASISPSTLRETSSCNPEIAGTEDFGSKTGKHREPGGRKSVRLSGSQPQSAKKVHAVHASRSTLHLEDKFSRNNDRCRDNHQWSSEISMIAKLSQEDGIFTVHVFLLREVIYYYDKCFHSHNCVIFFLQVVGKICFY